MAQRDSERDRTGVLTLAAVPIGRAEDASARLAEELAGAAVIAAEDTRRVRWLAASLGITLTARVISYYDAVETRRAGELVAVLQGGQDVLLVTDAGMPGISDPGYRLVAAAAAAGLRVTALPGPSAVTTALAVSGLPTDRFCFEGFPPRRPGERQRQFAELADDRRTQVYFESGRRLAVTLAELAALARRGPAGRRVPRADQDPRGDPPRHPGRAGRLGGRRLRRRPWRDHAGRRRNRTARTRRRPGGPGCRSGPSAPRPGRPSRPGCPGRPGHARAGAVTAPRDGAAGDGAAGDGDLGDRPGDGPVSLR